MKIRSLLLGSAALAGLATTGYAADLGVVTSLDVCDELGLSGLTISSDQDCLVITGGVTFEYDWGDYDPGRVYGDFQWNPHTNTYNMSDPGSPLDSNGGDVDAYLKFAATSDTDFGQATATIKLIANDVSGTGNWNETDRTVGLGEAWVGIGDTTQLMAGYKSSIFNAGDDTSLTNLHLFNEKSVSAPDNGVGFRTTGANTGGDVIQVVSQLGNGLAVKGGLEGLGQTHLPGGVTYGEVTGVGVLEYAGDGITAHVSGAAGNEGWKLHAGFTGAWDPIKVVGAVSADDTGYWSTLGSVAATFDMFTLAAAGEATSEGEWGVGGSASAKVTDGVTINLDGRYFHGTVDGAYDLYQVQAGLSAAVTETLTLTGDVGAIDRTGAGKPLVFYGDAGVAWAPGGGFTSSASVGVNSLGGYKAVFIAAKGF